GADRPPEEVAEVDEQVGGRGAADVAVKVLGLEDAGADGPAVGAAEGLQLGDEAVAGGLVLVGGDQSLGLAPLDVEEEAAVVPPRAPGGGTGPVHLQPFQPGRGRGGLVE